MFLVFQLRRNYNLAQNWLLVSPNQCYNPPGRNKNENWHRVFRTILVNLKAFSCTKNISTFRKSCDSSDFQAFTENIYFWTVQIEGYFLKNIFFNKKYHRTLNVNLLETCFLHKNKSCVFVETRVRIHVFFIFPKVTTISSSVFDLKGFLKIEKPFKAKTLEEIFVNFGKNVVFWTKNKIRIALKIAINGTP